MVGSVRGYKPVLETPVPTNPQTHHPRSDELTSRRPVDRGSEGSRPVVPAQGASRLASPPGQLGEARKCRGLRSRRRRPSVESVVSQCLEARFRLGPGPRVTPMEVLRQNLRLTGEETESLLSPGAPRQTVPDHGSH